MYVIPVMVTMKNKLKFAQQNISDNKIPYNCRNNERNNNLFISNIKGY